MSNTKTLVLDQKKIKQKITRMAFEIYERNAAEEVILFAGITGMGYKLAEFLASSLESISPIQTKVIEINLDKSDVYRGEVKLSENTDLTGKCVIIVDDVLNTGKTLVYALKPFLDLPIKKMEVAVLVNRSHKLFPVTPDYTGLELATTLNEHITVDLTPENQTVHLH
ncbi:pyrimidine regulatory protein PyrR [Indibacter alkaliphilus LW1]|jgi:pyrimidine operon attenuation protein/uracil phosphoribosyltransferase|uniref:Pyrimidine regulatory protein PyrR n=1 Tax=Indibacter alkaliphilus (strain CCUG 57479 / KCTC 22604 / LW1) TaxID=1189612 RepID=S2DK05_INDAL|nr:phosphoribosyltransferase family protein [Indibacter alkaliphilus]EOZ92331.1 pyrimidine regulatory protein PyrR [Indibacter alkaliphilus LW1]